MSDSSTLAADTETGKKYILSQSHTIIRICSSLKCEMAGFGDKASHADYILVKDGVCGAVIEIKSRELTLDKLKAYNNPPGYLISNDKLVYGEDIARRLGAPFYVFARLLWDDIIVYFKVFDSHGIPMFDYPTDVTETQETCEDKKKVNRRNAYLPLKHMRTLKEEEDGIKSILKEGIDEEERVIV